MEGVAAPTSEDSLEREAQGGARRYVSRHRMSPNAWSSPTLRPSAEAECISSTSVLSPHNSNAEHWNEGERAHAVCPYETLIRPLPVGDLIGVGAVLVGVGEVLDDGILHLFLHVGGGRAQLGHPINHINHQVEAVNLIQNG
jgi:hypothetical protein